MWEPITSLGASLHKETIRYLQSSYPRGLYRHQLRAIERWCAGDDVCLATGTASGKSALFFTAGIETLAKRYKARVLAMYPTRALAQEQAARWRQALAETGRPWSVGLIDGSVHKADRAPVLREADVIVSTPDVTHSWLLPSVGSNSAVRTFLQHLRLIVVDEVHTYSGVMGTNSAFLFRRLAHVTDALGGAFRLVCASATIAEPEEHVAKLFGRPFTVIGSEQDTSPRYPVTVEFLSPPPTMDVLPSLAHLLRQIVSQGKRVIAFLDSRQQVEIMGAMLQRQEADADDDDANDDRLDEFAQAGILPYRSGYEAHDRQAIQQGLTSGSLRGVVSTSALELGMDIPNLDVAVLVGLPKSQTSFLQRIGRVGRHRDGHVIILHSKTAFDDTVFDNPHLLWQRPLTEAVLYLEHPRAQYIHAMCLAGIGGEHDLAVGRRPSDPDTFQLSSSVDWPPGFADLCQAERSGQVPPEFDQMRMEAGDSPHHTYFLRDVERRFVVERQEMPDIERLGDLSFSQLMREAYPGAIYRYMGRGYRVTQIFYSTGKVIVRREKQYHTRPYVVPPRIFPQMDRPGTKVYQCGHGVLIESDILVDEMVTGFVEQRGRARYPFDYPIQNHPDLRGVRWDRPVFQRRYVTHGISFYHPDLRESEMMEALMGLLLDAYAAVVPFETQDVNVGIGKVTRSANPVLPSDVKMVTLYDRVYGSLHLAARILEPGVLERVADQMDAYLRTEFWRQLDPKVHLVGASWTNSLREPLVMLGGQAEAAVSGETEHNGESRVRVILPGSIGYVEHEGKPFLVKAVFFKPAGLFYRGLYPDDKSHENCEIQLPVHRVTEMPGESRYGWYDVDSGEMIEDPTAGT
ncbi:DEAD/DEAH box helicase [Alicyclobacillus sendaiensis]|uniref:DEAD/DEAH box helicase n=1 Tax=Alicyclobacillus sendaiensis TaxID=192387 RepID=UPI00272C0735|nr:DEAD/DEAH box helicase [Alicyclobacillus sendaiensis]